MRRRRSAVGEASREHAASAVARRLMANHFFRRSDRIGAYLAFGKELSVRPTIERAWQLGKQVYVPVIEPAGKPRMRFSRIHPDTPLVSNRFGIAEPAPGHLEFLESRWLDLVLVPLVAFDRMGNRLGMGGGYYDRCFNFLRHRSHWLKPRLCGIAYSFQEVDGLEPEDWDVSLSCIVTEQALLQAA